MPNTFKLGVISDTHGQILETREAVAIFRAQGVEKIIHCGDIGGVGIVELFEGIETHFVLGNTDGDSRMLREAVSASGGVMHGWFGTLQWGDRNIFFLHGHQSRRFNEALDAEQYDLICYGHTHQPAFHVHGARGTTLLLNPGAFQRVRTPQIAIVELQPEINVESFAVNWH